MSNSDGSLLAAASGDNWVETGLKLIFELFDDFASVDGGTDVFSKAVENAAVEIGTEFGDEGLCLLLVLSAANAKFAREVIDAICAIGVDGGEKKWRFRQASVSLVVEREAEFQALAALLLEIFRERASGRALTALQCSICAALRCSHELLSGIAKDLCRLYVQEQQVISQITESVERITNILAVNRALIGEKELSELGTEIMMSDLGVETFPRSE